VTLRRAICPLLRVARDHRGQHSNPRSTRLARVVNHLASVALSVCHPLSVSNASVGDTSSRRSQTDHGLEHFLFRRWVGKRRSLPPRPHSIKEESDQSAGRIWSITACSGEDGGIGDEQQQQVLMDHVRAQLSCRFGSIGEFDSQFMALAAELIHAFVARQHCHEHIAEASVAFLHGADLLDEGDEPLPRVRDGERSAGDVHGAGDLADGRLGDELHLASGEVPVEGGDAHSRLLGDLLERHVDTSFRIEGLSRCQKGDPVLDGVRSGTPRTHLRGAVA
jgi:hypothetical protein